MSDVDQTTQPSTAEDTAPSDRVRRSSRGRRVLLTAGGILLVAITVAIFAIGSGWFNRLTVALFGPPQVQSREAYAEREDGPTFDHSSWDQLLREQVDKDGWVDYPAIQRDQSRLDAYISSVAEAPFDAMGRTEKLTLLINAYNAFTVKLIVEHYPVDSIKDIRAADRWDAERWNVGGNIWSLNQIEHEQIRPKFVEPRIHFALVCAAVGCPPLRNEAFTATELDRQLEEQAEYVHQHGTWYEFDASRDRVKLTQLYNWYGDDFRQYSGSELEYIAQYDKRLKRLLDDGRTPRVQWLTYDWTLNDIEHRAAR